MFKVQMKQQLRCWSSSFHKVIFPVGQTRSFQSLGSKINNNGLKSCQQVSVQAKWLSTSASAGGGATDPLKDHMQAMKLAASIEPIPFTKDIPITPLNDSVQGAQLAHKKVTIVGCGQVGMAIGYAILNQTTAGTIALVDMNEDKLMGEAKDLQQGSGFHENVRIVAGSTYDVSAQSHLVIVTAGAAQKPGESRLSLVERNSKIMQGIIPQVLAHSPDAAICIVSNPYVCFVLLVLI